MDTKLLRLKYHNDWPKRFQFPAEEAFDALMHERGIVRTLVPANLALSDDHTFQSYLGFIIDALDMLPMRPDLAFEHLWKALDAEFFIVQQEIGNHNCSRFDGFVDKVLNDPKTAAGFLQYLPSIPLQTCEYGAKRVIEASSRNDNHSNTLLGRAKSAVGEPFINELVCKFPPSANHKPSSSDQRNAGRLFKMLFNGQAIELNGTQFAFTDKQRALFVIKVILANSRNERFHGGVFPPFRSSAATTSTYSHAYYLFHISYALLLDVFLYREYGVIQIDDVRQAIVANVSVFNQLFGDLT